MSPTEAAAKLQHFNDWRRGHHDDTAQPDPREIGEAIDAAIEMIDRLEAAEADALEQARLNGMGASREAALIAKLEAAEKERDDVAQQLVQSEIGKREISEAHNAVTRRLSVLADENTTLRAKMAEMERQEPVGYMPLATKAALEAGGTGVIWNCRDRGAADEPLYALPGANGEEK